MICGLTGILAWVAMAFPVAHSAEIIDFDIRSPQDKPFIAHVNLKLTDKEWAEPEAVKVSLQSTTVAEYSAQLRTRLFLQPSAKLAFLRISGLEPLNREMGFNIEAQDGTGPSVRQFIVSGQTVRSKDIQVPTPQVPVPLSVEMTPPKVESGASKSKEGKESGIPKNQMEVRLLDQTAGKALGRSTLSDLELLAKADQALNTNPEDQKRARSALDSVRALWVKSSDLLEIKASQKLRLAQAEKPPAVLELPPIAAITLDASGNAVGGANKIQQLEQKPESKAQVELKPEQRPKPELESVPSPVVSAQAQEVNKPAQSDESSLSGFLPMAAFALAFLVLGAWLLWKKRSLLQQRLVLKVATSKQANVMDNLPVNQAEKSGLASYTAAQTPEYPPTSGAQPSSRSSSPDPFDEDALMDDASRPPEADVLGALHDMGSVSERPENSATGEDDWLGSEVQVHQIEPEYKNENDIRMEMAFAFLEIEDYDAALKAVEQIRGTLTQEQKARLSQLKQSILQAAS